MLGVRREAKIANLLKENGTLLKLGIFFESRNMQVRIHETLEANYDKGTSQTLLVLCLLYRCDIEQWISEVEVRRTKVSKLVVSSVGQ